MLSNKRPAMKMCRSIAVIALAVVACFSGPLSLAPARADVVRSDRIAASYGNGATLLHQSFTSMQQTLHDVHGTGLIEFRSCCRPKLSALAHLAGDCVVRGKSFSLRFTEQGSAVHNQAVVSVHTRFIVKPSAKSTGLWTRSLAAHSRWHIDRSPQWEFGIYLCPGFLMAEFYSHFPPKLVNLGPVTVHGIAAWHVQYKIAGKNVVFHTDFYLAQKTLYWLRFESLTSDNSSRQHVLADYSNFNVPVRIIAPTVGSSTP